MLSATYAATLFIGTNGGISATKLLILTGKMPFCKLGLKHFNQKRYKLSYINVFRLPFPVTVLRLHRKKMPCICHFVLSVKHFSGKNVLF